MNEEKNSFDEAVSEWRRKNGIRDDDSVLQMLELLKIFFQNVKIEIPPDTDSIQLVTVRVSLQTLTQLTKEFSKEARELKAGNSQRPPNHPTAFRRSRRGFFVRGNRFALGRNPDWKIFALIYALDKLHHDRLVFADGDRRTLFSARAGLVDCGGDLRRHRRLRGHREGQNGQRANLSSG